MKRFLVKQASVLGGILGAILLMLGTYNTFILNTSSFILGDVTPNIVRLDDLGQMVKGVKTFATTKHVQPIIKKTVQAVVRPVVKQVAPVETQSSDQIVATSQINDLAAAIIKKDLDLELKEVSFPKMRKKPFKAPLVSGNIVLRSGQIEEANLALPQGIQLEIFYGRIQGNVFKYDYEGEQYSASIFEVKDNEYLLTLADGPLSGLRARFHNPSAQNDRSAPVVDETSRMTEQEMRFAIRPGL